MHTDRILRILPLALGLALAGLVAQTRPAAAIDHCGEVSSNETWSAADNPHILTCDVRVRNSTLTLEPGAIVQLAEGASLVIGQGSSLQSVGTQEAPIQIRGATRNQEAGFWSQLLFEDGAGDSFFDWVTVLGGGRDGAPMIEVLGGSAELFRINLRLTGGPPMAFAAGTVGPSLGRAGGVSVGRCQVVSTGTLGEERIVVYAGDEHRVEEDALWADFCLPYEPDATLTVGGVLTPTLTIGPGTTLAFPEGASLVAGVDETLRGQVSTDGSLDENVLLTAAGGETGGWGGVELTPYGDGSFFINTRIEKGGSAEEAMLRVRDPFASAIELVLREAPGYPLEIDAPAVSAFFVGLGQTAEPLIAENGVDRALVRAAAFDVDTTGNARWVDIGAPYEIDGDLLVAGGEEGTANMRVDAGAELLFAEGSALTIGHPEHGVGALDVRGVPAAPVVMAGVTSGPGAWDGVRVTDRSDESYIEALVLRDGGADGPMLQWGDVRGVILRSELRGSADHPLALPLGRITAILGEDHAEPSMRNRFEENAKGSVLVDSARRYDDRLSTWYDPGAPLEMSEDFVLAAPGTPVLSMHGGVELLFRPGQGLRVGADDEARAVLRLAAGRDAAEPVLFGASAPAEGWAGATVATQSTFETEEDGPPLAIDGLAGEGVGLTVQGGLADLVGLTVPGTGESTGLRVTEGGSATVVGPDLRGHAVGAHALTGGRFILSEGWIHGNADYAALVEDPEICATATLIYWGSEDGPNDPSDAEDDCMDRGNESDGDRVSDDVDWARYAIDEDLTPVDGPILKKPIFLPATLRNGALGGGA